MIRNNKILKFISLTLLFVFLNSLFYPSCVWALTPAAAQPEYSSFEPVDATDMVNLLTGDFTYSLPIINIPGLEGGYPLSMFYHGGISPEQEASWVGLGWNINPGSINRFSKGIPDDWNNKTTSVITYNSPNTAYDWAASVNFSVGVGSFSIGVDGGSYKSLGGSVGMGLGKRFGDFSAGLFGSAGTNGIGIGGVVGVSSVNAPGSGASISVGASMDYSGNITGNASVGITNAGSLGVSMSSKGSAAYASVSNQTIGLGSNAVGKSDISMRTFTASLSIPITPNLTVGLSYNHYTYWLWKMENKQNYGSLYIKDAKNIPDPLSGGAQASSYIADSYENPTNSGTYNNYKALASDNALSFPNYDSYQVSGQGIAGSMSPKLFEFGTMSREALVFSKYGNGSATDELVYFNKYDFSKSHDKIYFLFDYDPGGYSKINPGSYSIPEATGSPLWDYDAGNLITTNIDGKSFYNATTQRSGKSKYVEWFTNHEIDSDPASATNKGFIESDSQKGNRGSADLYDADGIGAFSITAEDGKTYHYSVPVYQFEEIQVFENKSNPSGQYIENRKLDKYAYDWLLTAVTGPDYVDRGTIGVIDDQDYGYYVKFDYGKWTDGYVWRTPYQDGSYINDAPGNPNGSYSFGRKQIYYLNSITTKTHTAYFVKSLRNDGIGKNMTYSPNDEYHQRTDKVSSGVAGGNFCSGGGSVALGIYLNVSSEKEYFNSGEANQLLKLDKIILLSNKDANLSANNNSGNNNFKSKITTGSFFISRKTEIYAIDGKSIDNNYCNELNTKSFTSYYQENVLDAKDVQDDIQSIEKKALKVIEFNQDYLLCNNTPNSSIDQKLTLSSVKIFGKAKADIIPSYIFSYNNQSNSTTPISYDRANVDNWGNYATNKNDCFKKPNEDAWSLNTITTPLGGKMKINYEPDTYVKEVVFGSSGTYTLNVQSITKVSSTQVKLKLVDNIIDINEYATWLRVNENVYFNYIRMQPVGSAITQFNFNNYIRLISIDLNTNELLFEINDSNNTVLTGPIGIFGYVSIQANIQVSNGIACGGGIRVKDIVLDDGLGNNYKTAYSYNDPSTNITSGVTSFAPKSEDRYIPYIYELPAPMVMYEYVTVEDMGLTTQSFMKTRYKFDVLKNAQGYNTPAFSMGSHFKVEDIQSQTNITNYTEGSHWSHTYARSGVIKDNKAAIGRVLQVEVLNKGNLVQNKVIYDYFNPDDGTIKNGIVQETFNDIKRNIHWDQQAHTSSSSGWYTTSSSRITYPNVLKSITSTQGGITNTVTNSAFDFYSGNVTETQTSNSFGEKYKTVSVPAYTIPAYSGMGSMVYGGRNMITQEAANYVYSVDNLNNSKLLSANIQTWNDSWNYRNYDATTNTYVNYLDNPQARKDVWRKHQTFVWTSPVNADGTINPVAFQDYWANPANDSWQKTSEVTRYDHYSKPLEVKDINGNFVSSKMGYNESYPIASVANSKYTGFAYSGAEDIVLSNGVPTNYFGGEVLGADQRFIKKMLVNGYTQTIPGNGYAHTGNYCLKFEGGSGFQYKASLGDLTTADFKKGKTYRANVWMYNNPDAQFGALYCILRRPDNSVESSKYVNIASTSTKLAGKFYLLSLDIDIPAGSTASNIEVGAGIPPFSSLTQAPIIYFDDFRVHPVDAPMTSYVYDEQRGLVSAILDNENFATKFYYDNAGRLIRTDKETLQGFKKVSENTYHYGRQ